MSDERLISALRALDRPVDVDPAFDEALYAILQGEVARRRPMRPSLTALLVAAALAALLLGGVVAVGSGLVRLPWSNDRFTFGAAPGCPSELRPGQLLELEVPEDGYAVPGDEWSPPAGFFLRLYEDGLLLRAGYGRTREQIRTLESGMTARRLSPTGVQRMLEAAGQDMLGGGCHDRWTADLPGRAITVRGDDGRAGRVAWGTTGTFRIRDMTDDEEAAAERLVANLTQPESWLPAEAWIDPIERPYVPDRWLVNVMYPETHADPEGALGVGVHLPGAADVVLPDGTGLLELGDPYEEPDGIAAPGQPGARGRCAVVSTGVARSLTGVFADVGAVAFNGGWWFRHGADDLGVAIRPMLPGDEGCTARALGLSEPPGPSPSSPPVASGDLLPANPCTLLSESSVRAAHAVSPDELIAIQDRTGEIDPLGPEFRECWYRFGVDRGAPTTAVHVRSRRTEPPDARPLAQEFLGVGAIEEAVGDLRVWRNSCEPNIGACTPAIAIFVDPYFVVITVDWLESGDLAGLARDLATAIEVNR